MSSNALLKAGLLSAGALVLLAGAAGCKSCPFAAKGETAMTKTAPVKTYTKADFYDKDGKFDSAKAAQAYYDMMERFNTPVYDNLKTNNFWAIDFSLGEFPEVGMAGIFWLNDAEDGYFGHEIYLLPGQMIAEHSHAEAMDKVKDKDGKEKDVYFKPKIESWQVRQGSVYGFSEGTPNFDQYPDLKIPESQKKFLKVNHVEYWKADGVAHKLVAPKSWHFMMAGPEGAIVTEYATPHSNKGLRFANPGVKF